MNHIRIQSLKDISDDTLYNAHREAFADYPFSWSREAFDRMLKRRGYRAELSFGAFDNEQLVSFNYNCTGIYYGKLSAYDTSTGTIATHRNKGLAAKVFEYSIPYLKAAGIEQYLLDVLTDNTTAVALYKRQGFEITRQFDCFKTDVAGWEPVQTGVNNEIVLRPMEVSEHTLSNDMGDIRLSWQNQYNAMLQKPEDFIMIGAYAVDEWVGYGVIEPETGDIPMLAVRSDMRRRGIGSSLFNALAKQNKAAILRIVNIETTQTDVLEFIKSQRLPKIVSLFEMIKIIK